MDYGERQKQKAVPEDTFIIPKTPKPREQES